MKAERKASVFSAMLAHIKEHQVVKIIPESSGMASLTAYVAFGC